MRKRLILGFLVTLTLAFVAFLVAFNAYQRVVYPGLQDTDDHFDIAAAGVLAFLIVGILGIIVTAVWSWRATRRRVN